MLDREPIFLTWRIWSRKSSKVNSPSSSRAAASSAWSFSKTSSACSMRREHVAHAEDPPGHAVGVEQLEGVELLAGAGEGDGAARDLLDRQRRAAAGVAVELREDHAVELRASRGRPRPRSRRPDRSWRRRRGTCSSARPTSEIRRTWSIISASMARRPAVSTMSTSLPEAAGLVETLLGHRDRIAGARPGRLVVAEDADVDLAAEGAQLLDRGGPLEVGADEERVAALALEPAGQLGRVGRLARALEAGHQHDRRRAGGVGDLQASRRRGGWSAPG